MERKYHIVLKLLMPLLLLASRNESTAVAEENLSGQSWVGSKYQIECTMCSACDNPCNTPSPPPPSQQPPPPPPPTPTANCPPPPYPPIYPYYSPPPPQPTYSYYSPPPPGGGGYYKPPPPPQYIPTGPAPPSPNPIMPYFPYYYYNPPLPSLSPPSKKISSPFLIIMTSLFFIFC